VILDVCCIIFLSKHVFRKPQKVSKIANSNTTVYTSKIHIPRVRSGQTKDYKIGICCFSAKHAALRRKSKGWLTRNQNNGSEFVTCLSAGCCFSELAL